MRQHHQCYPAYDLTKDIPGCTPAQAAKIIEQRPFEDVDNLNIKLGQGKKKAGPGGISPRMFEDSTAIFEGYGMVDGILEDCEDIGASLRDAIASWTTGEAKGKGKQKEDGQPSQSSSRNSPATDDGALSLIALDAVQTHAAKDFLATQPSTLSEGTVLKDYQLLGVNWLNLLYRQGLSCILADEMGALEHFPAVQFTHVPSRTRKDHTGHQLLCSPQTTGQ